MEYALLGRTGLLVSRLAFGAMTFGQGAMAVKLSPEEMAELDALTKQKARYPNLRWLPDNTDAETMRGAVGKAKA